MRTGSSSSIGPDSQQQVLLGACRLARLGGFWFAERCGRSRRESSSCNSKFRSTNEPALWRCPYPRQEYDDELNRVNKKAGKLRIHDSTVHIIYLPPPEEPKERIAIQVLSGSSKQHALQLLAEMGGRPCRQGIPPVQRTAQPVTCSRLPDTVNTVNVNTHGPLSRLSVALSRSLFRSQESDQTHSKICKGRKK